MVRKLYWEDSYIKNFNATITRVDGKNIYLNETAFYPTGGGQSNDMGTIAVNGGAYKIVDVHKEGDDIAHVSETDVNASAGDAVECSIDWERKYACMRHHSAIHLIDAVVEKEYNGGKITGGQIYPERARIDMDIPDLDRDKAQKIIDRSNELASEGHDIIAKMITQEEALAIPRLARTDPGSNLLNNLENIRVVEIVGVDEQADGGTHVKNTSEIGKITLSKYESKGKHHKRVEITLS